MPPGADRLRASYVLPLRWAEAGPIGELASYLRSLQDHIEEIIVVDGSSPGLFESHAAALDGLASHLRPHPELRFGMGKVNGVLTGVREASHERIVVADDDVRYDATALRRTVQLLGEADLVRPQNYFDAVPWHARWDTARSLLNRVFTGNLAFPVGDFPGTLAVRRKAVLAHGGYDGDVLFENLELMRTVRAGGGVIVTPLDLFVARRPPTTAHFLSQRVRQAYDDFAMPLRLLAFLAAGPAMAALLRSRRWRTAAAAVAAPMAVAEIGRRRAGGARRFPASASVLAPLWVTERAICSWLALGSWLAGGARYGDGRLKRAATPIRNLRRRYAASGGEPAPGAGAGALSARNPAVL